MDHAVPRSGEPGRAEPLHGGRIAAAARAYPDAPQPWVDLSTGINPQPWPMPALPASVWTRLPEPDDLAALEAAALAAYGAKPGWAAVAAPGTSVLIAVLARLFPGPAAIVGPTYGEYAAAWPGAAVVPGLAEAVRAAGLRIACQPDNPTGAVHDPATLIEAARGGMVIADQSYADFVPEAALEPRTGPHPGLIVLRSFGKAYGLAGLRLGFALLHPAVAGRLRDALGPWPVSGAAIVVGTAALADSGWRTATAGRLVADRARLDGLLRRAGFAGLRGTPLFTLARAPADGWVEHLLRRGLLVRAFPDRPRTLRFGLPPPDGWDRVAEALGAGPI